MIDIIYAVVFILAIVMFTGATIVNSKKDKKLDQNIKELNKDTLELIKEIEISRGLRRSWNLCSFIFLFFQRKDLNERVINTLVESSFIFFKYHHMPL